MRTIRTRGDKIRILGHCGFATETHTVALCKIAMTYQPIENYGIIGDMNTVALVGMNGSIDWFCFPPIE
jgi:hypothetical protein